MSRTILFYMIFASIVASVIANTYVVNVGEDNKNQYVPNTVNVLKGDIVAFHFVGGQHDVIQSDSFTSCNKIANAFDSGINPSTSWYNYTVTLDNGKIWFFCSVGTHCKYSNMTGVMIVGDGISNNSTSDSKKSISVVTTPSVSTIFSILISSTIVAFFMFN